MAAQYILAFTFFAVTLFGSTTGVTDEEFQVGYIVLFQIRTKSELNLFRMISLSSTICCVLFQDVPPLVAKVIREMKEDIYVSHLS